MHLLLRGVIEIIGHSVGAGWSSLVARRAHNPKVVGSNPAPATNLVISLFTVVEAINLKRH